MKPMCRPKDRTSSSVNKEWVEDELKSDVLLLQRKCYMVGIHLPLLQICSRGMTAAIFTTNDIFLRNKEPSHSRSKEANVFLQRFDRRWEQVRQKDTKPLSQKTNPYYRDAQEMTPELMLVRLNKCREDLDTAHNSSFPTTTQTSLMDSGPPHQQRKHM